MEEKVPARRVEKGRKRRSPKSFLPYSTEGRGERNKRREGFSPAPLPPPPPPTPRKEEGEEKPVPLIYLLVNNASLLGPSPRSKEIRKGKKNRGKEEASLLLRQQLRTKRPERTGGREKQLSSFLFPPCLRPGEQGRREKKGKGEKKRREEPYQGWFPSL